MQSEKELTTAAKSKRIVKNTAMLYIRMLFVMAVSLYTSRIVLHALGEENYGIYNVVGGIIVMLGFFSGSLGSACSRFITFVLGKGDEAEVRKYFSTICCVLWLFAAIVVVLGETVGLWFVCHKLVIPPERMTAALWVYHCSVLTAVIAIVSVPYNALIIAHERMAAFAYVSIVEVVFKLLIAWALLYTSYDKLIVYAVLIMLVQVLIRVLYGCYCSRHFPESRTPLKWDKPIVRKIAAYAGWTLNGDLAVVGYTQGINVLLNLFFGPAVNAARGIAVQVQTVTMQFVQNFQTAVRPQIIKSYSVSDFPYMHTLVIGASKYGFFLIILLVFPLVLCVEPILRIWLGSVPEYTADFVRIMLFVALIEPFRFALINAIHATGDIKKFQLYEATTLLTIVPVAYVLLKIWHISPVAVMLVYFFIYLLAQGIRIWIVLPKIRMPYSVYFRKIIPRTLILLVCFAVPLYFFDIPATISWERLFLYAAAAVGYMAVCIGIFGFERAERIKFRSILKHRMSYGTKKSDNIGNRSRI